MKTKPTNLLTIVCQGHVVRWGRSGRRMASGRGLAAALMVAGFSTSADDAIDLKDQTASFTNLQGRVYENVQLKRATTDGLIYCDTNSSTMGMVHYSDLSPRFLADLKIPGSMISEAAQRQATLTAQKQQYALAVRQLALEEETNNAAKLATPAPSPAPATTDTTTSTPPKNKPAHHRHRA